MKPIIGITCDYDYTLEDNKAYGGYVRAIARFGGLSVLLPANSVVEDIPQILEFLEGILIIGGDDIAPSFFGESPHSKLGEVNPYRDKFEIELTRQAISNDMPILGICRGIQVINVAMGGTLYQDIESQFEGTCICHRQRAPKWYGIHEVYLNHQSRISNVFGHHAIQVNSFHHQAVKDIAPGFDVVGHASDGVIEAIEGRDRLFTVGVQWHPERMFGRYEHADNIFNEFINVANAYKNKTV